MSLHNKDLVAVQAKTKPKIENIAVTYEFSDSNMKETLLGFHAWLKENKFTCSWASTNAWKIANKGERIGSIRFFGGSLHLEPFMEGDVPSYVKYLADCGLHEVIWENVKYCVACSPSCAMRGPVMVAGKEFINVCRVQFKDPGPAEIECMKKLMHWYKRHTHGTSNRPKFDPVADGLHRIDNAQKISGISDSRGVSAENAEKLFDGSYAKSFYVGPYGPYKCDERNCEISFQLDEPATVVMYSLVTGGIPDKWTLYAANTKGGPWVQLDTRVASDAFPDVVTKFTEKAFKIKTPSLYRYYKIAFEGMDYTLSQMHLYVAT